MMVKYYNMHLAKMFVRGKLIKFGYKFCCLCNSEEYYFNFNSYLGKDAAQLNEPSGIRVINKLAEVLPIDKTENHELLLMIILPVWNS